MKAVFKTEADLCSAFIASLPEDWTAYPETAGFDILLIRAADGAQIGVEAKLTLNAKVLLQAIEGIYSGHGYDADGPDFRAALVPYGTAGSELKGVAKYLGVTVLECKDAGGLDRAIESELCRYGSEGIRFRASVENNVRRNYEPFAPELPRIGGYEWRNAWTDFCPAQRCKVPDYVPDVVAGASGPAKLSEWKIKAIKICVLLERRGWLSVSDFKTIGIDRKRWLDMHWIQGGDIRGKYIAGSRPLDLRLQHPTNFEQIAADFEKWAPKAPQLLPQGELL